MVDSSILTGGIKIDPMSYYAHWIVEFTDKSQIRMFENGIKNNFEKAIGVRNDILFAFWKPLKNDRSFGIIKYNNLYHFVIDGFILRPDIEGYQFFKNAKPKLFIRNKIKVNVSSFSSTGSSFYYAQIDYFDNNEEKSIAIFWNGISFYNVGFTKIYEVGKVILE